MPGSRCPSSPKREWISSGREKTANQKLSLDAHTGGKGEDGAPGLSKAAKANVAKMEEAVSTPLLFFPLSLGVLCFGLFD